MGAGYALRRTERRWPRVLLAVLCGIAVVAGFLSFNDRAKPWSRHFLNGHDVFHYYFGAKYSPEIPNTRLYHCTIVALDEMNPKLHKSVRTMRSLVNYGHVRKSWFLTRPKMCTKRFSPQRWNEFKADLRAFQRDHRSGWRYLLGDKGYNATPVWNALGHLITNHVPIRPWQVFNILGMLDLALLAIGFGVLTYAFGWWGPALGLVYLGALHALTLGHIRGAFLRLDWLCALMVGLALLKRKRFMGAGVALAYATMVRAFPAIFLFGPGVQALRVLIRDRRPAARHLRLFGAWAGTCALLFTLSVVADGGMQGWSRWATKMQLHVNDICTQRVGVEYVLSYRGERSQADVTNEDGTKKGFRPHYARYKQEVNRRMRPVRIPIILAVMGVLGWLLWRRDEAEALALSFPLVYVLTSPTFYYFGLLIPPFVWAASAGRKRLAPAVIAAALALEEGLFQYLRPFRLHDIERYFWHSVALGVVVLITLTVLVLEKRGVGPFAVREEKGEAPEEPSAGGTEEPGPHDDAPPAASSGDPCEVPAATP